MSVQIIPEPELLLLELSDLITVPELLEMINSLAALEAREQRSPHRVIDVTRCSFNAEIGFSELSALSSIRQQITVFNPYKVAVVASEPVHYGLARMYQALNRNPLIDIAIFPTMTEARRWIAQELPAPASVV